jgi:hypothetical protein
VYTSNALEVLILGVFKQIKMIKTVAEKLFFNIFFEEALPVKRGFFHRQVGTTGNERYQNIFILFLHLTL